MIWILGLLAGPALAEPIVALDYVPFSRGDLVWLEEDWTSGTGVGEFDGLLKTPLTPWIGVRGSRWTTLGTVGSARFATVTSDSNGRHTVSKAGVRLGASLQRTVGDWEITRPWVGLGAWGVIPFVRDQSDAYNKAQTAEAEFDAAADRARIGGIGARAGGGLDMPVLPGAKLGFNTHLVTHSAISFSETSTQVSLLTWMETALRLEITLR